MCLQYSFIIIYIGRRRRRRNRSSTGYNTIMKTNPKTESRGVRREDKISYYNKRGNSKSRGVRKEYDTCYIIENTISKQKKNMLFYSKPCVCGSLHHATTRHTDCYLNSRYDDAVPLNNVVCIL